ncbi:hypothetical protein BUC_5644 [Burkholderia pseudomallei 576]|nr:hypothetical protein BUC_5644 [Burkholderia pseudomallei 576]
MASRVACRFACRGAGVTRRAIRSGSADANDTNDTNERHRHAASRLICRPCAPARRFACGNVVRRAAPAGVRAIRSNQPARAAATPQSEPETSRAKRTGRTRRCAGLRRGRRLRRSARGFCGQREAARNGTKRHEAPRVALPDVESPTRTGRARRRRAGSATRRVRRRAGCVVSA